MCVRIAYGTYLIPGLPAKQSSQGCSSLRRSPFRATPAGSGGDGDRYIPGVVGAAPLRRPGYEQRTPVGVQTPIGHTDRRSESATPYRGRGTPFNNWSTGLRGCAPRPVARERAPTRGAVHESDKSDKSDVLPKLVALPGIPTFVRGGSAAEGAILLETEYTKRGRRWGLATRPATSVYLLNGSLGEAYLTR